MNHWSLFKESFGKMLHPVLWIYGFFAAGGPIYFLGLLMNRLPTNASGLGNSQQLMESLRSSTATIIATGLVALIVVMIFSAFGQAAVMNLINRLENGERINVGLGVDAGGRFMHLFAVRLILAFPSILMIVLIIVKIYTSFLNLFSRNDLFSAATSSLGGVPGFILLSAIVSLITGTIGIGAERAVVLEERSVFASIGIGWKLMWFQLGDYIVIALIFILLGIGLTVFVVCGLAALFAVSFNPAALATRSSSVPPILPALAGMLIGTFSTVFNLSVWTLAYRQWRADAAVTLSPA